MTAKETYQKDIMYWPVWLSDAEQERIIKAAAAGEDARRDTVIIAGMLYLGLTAKEAAAIRYCTANGDAIERKGGAAFLHIPNAYRRLIYGAMGELDTIPLTDKLITCTQKEAEAAAEGVLSRAGIAAEVGLLRLRRTAARLHYVNGWTWEGDILKWFSDIEYIPEEHKVLFYREKTDAEEQAELDAAMEKMPALI